MKQDYVIKSEPIRTCPHCHKKYQSFPALSRRDNKTEICSQCGQQEALNDFFGFRQK